MERKRPISSDSLVNLPRATRQYWEGQYDALMHWSEILNNLAQNNPSSKQIQRLAMAARTKAVLIGQNKLTVGS